MPRVSVDDNEPMNVQMKPEQKSRLIRAKATTAQTKQIQLSDRDSLRVLDLLENAPEPNAKLRAVAALAPLT